MFSTFRCRSISILKQKFPSSSGGSMFSTAVEVLEGQSLVSFRPLPGALCSLLVINITQKRGDYGFRPLPGALCSLLCYDYR